MTIVTTAELKAHSNLSDDEDDVLLDQKIAAAEGWCAGYIGASLVDLDPLPAGIREAILRIAADLYENREATLIGASGSTLPFGVTDLLGPHKVWSF
ncbi:head-tail connector protein [Mesorhizobium sp. L103C119B0]|uniref:head-tail connector protein n=1 Tax=Mesorhizobium sp. L103C119B0 TaxID=1287085 RepID=UPI0004119DBA|nr:head-tail connector protein [Mesorhizobium sp. L103C119B0]